MLEAIAHGKPVVNHLWLESCGQAGCYIDEKNYILRDAKKEKELGFSMSVSLKRASQHPLLEGRRVLITPNTKPGVEILSSLVKAVHGQAFERICRSIYKGDKLRKGLLVLSCEEDYEFCVPLLKKGAEVYSSELLLSSIVIQKLEFESLTSCPKHGLHNPFKSPERYLLYGDISAKAGQLLGQPEVTDFFARLIQRVSPKSYHQAQVEVLVTQKFLENFSGDQVRFLARSFGVPGNHLGQQSHGFRWPYGPVTLITPFNFPLEIPLLQLMGALYMGNKPTLKVDSKVSIVMEQMIRLLHACGLPMEDVDFINSDGKTMNKLLTEANPRMTLFTGSSRVAEKLAGDLQGRIKLEDAGFDWKILGPDVQEVDYVAWVCDQDAYACSGQKCSAQSLMFMHENWAKSPLLSKLKQLAGRRKLEDVTIGPVLTFTTEAMLDHMNKLLKIPGSKLLFGGEPLENHTIPKIYGAIKPTAVFIPLEEILKENTYELVTTEIFGPFQVVTEYKSSQIPMLLEVLERMHAHLTAAVVSNDLLFMQEIIGNSVNGTTYAGLRARTTGAPQNHWFGPAGDPRGAGIGTPEAIKLVWSCHREIIYDVGPIPHNWQIPSST